MICFIFRLEDGQTGRDRGSGTATDKYSIQAEGSASQDAEQTNAGEWMAASQAKSKLNCEGMECDAMQDELMN